MKKLNISEKWFEFSTDSVDVLGQGVSKTDGLVSFVSKSLPGEIGRAREFFRKKKWRRGILSSPSDLTIKSKIRKVPDCPHFNQCFGCHFLHTEYNNELMFKKKALENHLRKLNPPEIEVISSKNRLAYRNRMQLHYDLEQMKIGMMGPFGITETPKCLLPIDILAQGITEFISDKWWNYPIFKDCPPTGHIEFYLGANGKMALAINQTYAHLGFTQVNPLMNKELVQLLTETVNDNKNGELILDLFGGNGNLTAKLNSNVLICDGFANTSSDFQESMQIDLYSKNALKKVSDKVNKKNINGIIIDPPRSGFKEIDLWINHFLAHKDTWFIYVSCSPDTFSRDIENIYKNASQFKLRKLFLIDMFPGTHHFESVGIFTKTEKNAQPL